MSTLLEPLLRIDCCELFASVNIGLAPAAGKWLARPGRIVYSGSRAKATFDSARMGAAGLCPAFDADVAAPSAKGAPNGQCGESRHP